MKKTLQSALFIIIGFLASASFNQVQAQKGGIKVAYISVVNGGLDSANVICQRIENAIIDTSENYFCWDECFIPSVGLSGIVRIGPGDTVANFIGDYAYTGGQALTDPSSITYRFYIAENLMDSASVTISYGPNSPASLNYGTVVVGTLPVGIKDILAENKNAILNLYPNPAESFVVIDYTLKDGAIDGEVTLRNILGELVYSGNVYGSFGKTMLPVEDLNNGVYFCTIVADGAIQQTRRFVVNH